MLRKLAAAVILIGLTQPYACDVRPVTGVWEDVPSALLFGVPLLAAFVYGLLTLVGPVGRALQASGPAWHGVLRAVFFLLAGGYLVHAVRPEASGEDRLGVAAALLVAGVILVWHQGRGTKADRLPLLLLTILGIPIVDLLVWSQLDLQAGGWLVSAGWALAVVEEVRLLRVTPSIVHGG